MGKLGNCDLLAAPKGPQLTSNGQFQNFFRPVARPRRLLRPFGRHCRGDFLNTHLSTSILAFDLLIYGPVFLLVSYL